MCCGKKAIILINPRSEVAQRYLLTSRASIYGTLRRYLVANLGHEPSLARVAVKREQLVAPTQNRLAVKM
jgi:hypothetical protein